MIDEKPQPEVPKKRKEISKGRLHPDVLYTFNLSPSDEFQCFCKPKQSLGDYDREKEFVKSMEKTLSVLNLQDLNVVATVEITEPTVLDAGKTVKGARLHLHGLIKFHNYKAIKWFLLYGLTILCDVGKVEIDTIDDLEWRMNYQSKMSYLEWPTIGHVTGYNVFFQDEPRKKMKRVRVRKNKTA